MTAFVICVGSSLLSKTADVTVKRIVHRLLPRYTALDVICFEN